jgi:hypothetical protein
MNGQVNVTLFPYQDATPATFSGASQSILTSIAHSFTPDPDNLGAGTLASITIDWGAIVGATQYKVIAGGQEYPMQTSRTLVADAIYNQSTIYTIYAYNSTDLVNPIAYYTGAKVANGSDCPRLPYNVTTSISGSSYTINWTKGIAATNTLLYINGSPVKDSTAASDSYTSTSGSDISYTLYSVNNWSNSGLSGSYTNPRTVSGTIVFQNPVVATSVDIGGTLYQGTNISLSVGYNPANANSYATNYKMKVYAGDGTLLSDLGDSTTNLFTVCNPFKFYINTFS